MNRPSSVAEDSALPLSTRRLASAGYRDALELGLEPLHDIGFHRANACRTADGHGGTAHQLGANAVRWCAQALRRNKR